MPNTRVLIVDDSVVVRQLVSKVLKSDPELEVVGVAASGAIALAKIPQVNPDLIILDLEMPDMDGLTTLSHMQKTHAHLPVIIFSVLTQRGAIATLEALSQGAKDYLTKPSSTSKAESIRYIQEHLIPKIKALAPNGKPIGDPQEQRPYSPSPVSSARSAKTVMSSNSTPRSLNRSDSSVPVNPSLGNPYRGQSSKRNAASNLPSVEVIAIGVSTGGPNALATLLGGLSANLPVPIVIVQHMPPLFTERLADRLNHQSPLDVVEGANGMVLQSGQVAIAPGNFHMEVKRQGTQVILHTHQSPPENSCRPAVDVLFRSVVEVYGSGTLGVILTGMGQDGFHGCQCIQEVGGQILAQDEATSVVWGMPGIVVNAHLADGVFPLPQLGAEIMKRVGGC